MARHSGVTGLDRIFKNMELVEKNFRQDVYRNLEIFAAYIENYAKDHRPWTDRTGNARRSLTGTTAKVGVNNILTVLAIGVDYGVYLELSNGGRWRVILPTVLANREKYLTIIKTTQLRT